MILGKLRGITMAFNSGLLTATGSEALYDTTVDIPYAINGKFSVLSAVGGGTAIAVDANGDAFLDLAASEGCILVWGAVAAASVMVIMQSEIKALDPDTDDWFSAGIPSFPVIPDTMCPMAYQVLKNVAGNSDFVIGTTNWDQITDLIVDVATLPDRPQQETVT